MLLHSTQQPVFLLKTSSWRSSAQSRRSHVIRVKTQLTELQDLPCPTLHHTQPFSSSSYPLAHSPLDNLAFSPRLEPPGSVSPPGFCTCSASFCLPQIHTPLTFPPSTLCFNIVFSERCHIILCKYATPLSPLTLLYFFHSADLAYLVCLWLI